MSKKTRLELTWLGKDEKLNLEPRILLEDKEYSFHADKKYSESDFFDNKLIFGDNLLALKALEQEYTGKIKCVFIDPPYNTGNAFEHYDDGLEHSIWLSLLKERLVLIHKLLSDEGSLWITIDDTEVHYLKIVCDEIFGRENFVSTIVWQHSIQGKNDAKYISHHHNYVLVYRKTEKCIFNRLPRLAEHNKAYSNPDNDPNGPWRSGDVRSPNHRENLKYDVITPNGNIIKSPEKGWRWNKETFDQKVSTGEITFVDDETRVLRKIYLKNQAGRVAESIWFGKDVGTTREASNEVASLVPNEERFATPKPEKLIQRVLQIATNEGDWVLDSFAGSGTTGAVAHKMGRKWIMVELGEHAYTHIVPRLKQVINGSDQGGISESVKWQGGGGFRFYKIAPSLLQKDKYNNWIISKEYNPEMLAEAMCKLEGFNYNPDINVFWKHGQSTETDFIYVTTQYVNQQIVADIANQLQEDETLLICCKAFNVNQDEFPRITLKKIPQMVLNKCEFGRDDYSLNVSKLPFNEKEAEQMELFDNGGVEE